ncbi:MAG: isocitrate/isopropylmalate family dehydrogenase, partial [Anaerolineales bacterium]
MSNAEHGHPIFLEHGQLVTPPDPVIPFIEGDGSGEDIWRAAHPVLNAAVEKSYQGQRRLVWKEVYAGEKALRFAGTSLPEETLQAFRSFLVGIKGPLGTPVGGGMRSLNVALRKDLDLYVCLRPVRWLPGVPAPVHHPERVDMVIFRENTEDVYTGIEFEYGSEENQNFKALLREHFPAEYARMRFPES